MNMEKETLLECEQYVKNKGILKGAAFSGVFIPSYKLTERSAEACQAFIAENRSLFFVEKLLSLIDKSGQKDSEVYKKAGIDRRLFSKIRTDKTYNPSKKTVFALCLALGLDKGEAERLLASAGYSFSYADDFDLVIAFCIERKIYDFFHVNDALNHFGLDVF